MKLFCKAIGTGLILVSTVGCAGDDPTQTVPPTVPVTKPSTPANANPGAAQGGMSAEMQPQGAPAVPAKNGEQKAEGGPQVEGPKAENEQGAAGKTSLNSEQVAKIKELPAEEQQAALTQASCPVSGEPLGSMGKPFKVSALGRSFYLCCKGCEKEVKADPKSVLAKLDHK